MPAHPRLKAIRDDLREQETQLTQRMQAATAERAQLSAEREEVRTELAELQAYIDSRGGVVAP